MHITSCGIHSLLILMKHKASKSVKPYTKMGPFIIVVLASNILTSQAEKLFMYTYIRIYHHYTFMLNAVIQVIQMQSIICAITIYGSQQYTWQRIAQQITTRALLCAYSPLQISRNSQEVSLKKNNTVTFSLKSKDSVLKKYLCTVEINIP